jgi:transposase
MKPLVIKDAQTVILGLQDEIRRSEEARYDHRLHAVLLIAQGISIRQVAKLLGDSPRGVAYWVRHFEEEGLAGLAEATRPGRPCRLDDEKLDRVAQVLRQPPLDVGLSTNIWDGKTLSAFIHKEWGIELRVRQCQRIFRQLGFRLRKPRPARSNPEKQEEYKKTSDSQSKSGY